MQKLLYGAAYYDEYMPCERLKEDVELMKKAKINLVRIAESTWSTYEPQKGVFDFSHVDRVLDAMEQAGINVIVGTPTYAIPTWLVKEYPDILATTKEGRGIYGARQNMDITHPAYRFYVERIVRKLLERTADRKCVIGFQLDNETKYYGTAGKNVQQGFVKYLKEKFHGDLDAMNREFGLDYWSNRINAWEDFPDVRGTINGSLGAEFEKYQRGLVTEYLAWLADLVGEYKREDQFVTTNLDFEWRGYSYGIQPDVDHPNVSRQLSVVGVDIYHPSQDALTGKEIAFGGDLARSLKRRNYLVLETQAQGFPNWTPYPGQLRLQAFSHLASGANAVEYWHWHSLHNAKESYWKGVLSHDLKENEVYREASVIGQEMQELSDRLIDLKKENAVAILVSNEALTALNWFPIRATASENGELFYNDVVRQMYDALYEMNVECDIIWENADFSAYRAILVPAFYAMAETTIQKLRTFTGQGGLLISTYKTAFCNENSKIYHDLQPHGLTDVFGMHYQQFTFPENVGLQGLADLQEEPQVRDFMELLQPDDATVIATYAHAHWNRYAAITEHPFGKGRACYIGCGLSGEALKQVLAMELEKSGIVWENMYAFPVIIRKGTNKQGETIVYYLNYSAEYKTVPVPQEKEVLMGEYKDGAVVLKPWDVAIVAEEKQSETTEKFPRE